MTHNIKLVSEARPISPPRDHADESLTVEPITMTVPETCRITGYGPTTVWRLIKEGKIKVLRLEGVRRTLPYVASVKELLGQPPPAGGTSAGPPATRRREPDRHPATAQQSPIAPTPPPRPPRGRRRKQTSQEATASPQ